MINEHKPVWVRATAGTFVGVIGAVVVAAFGGPPWADFMTFWLSYQIVIK